MFIFGLGYTGLTLAREAVKLGAQVVATSRDAASHPAKNEPGIRLVDFDAVPLDTLRGASFILSTIAPDAEGDPALRHYAGVFKEASMAGAWLGYLSTTGVYGDHRGEWVDENSALRGSTTRLAKRMEAELGWRGIGGHIFRLGGIYGLGRNALVDVMGKTARRLDKPGQFFSRIHVDDIAGAVLSSMAQPAPGMVYNVVDDEPSPAHHVVAQACALLSAPLPPLEPYAEVKATLSPMMQSFYAANRRVRNTRLKETLGYTLRFPTAREGLAALAQDLLIDADDAHTS